MSGVFGFLRLDTVPVAEPALDPVPFREPETGCLIVSDARIDYREGLCRSLGLDPAVVSDPELVLAAYLQWGEACLDRLLGDFAFAIWDPRDSKLFCARDHFGMRPFYYHHTPRKRFVFASDARDIFSVPDVPYAINEGRVADFLVPELEWIDYTSSFYKDVYRLPPGHRLTVTPGGISINEYWEPAPGPALSAMSDQEWTDGLLEVLGRAVAERLRGPAGRVGCMLSGGMDSGSVAAMASELLQASGAGPLCTFSAARGDDDCDETRRIHATVYMLRANATILTPEVVADRDTDLVASIEEPFDGVFLFMKAIFLAARDAGMTALLDGGGGDVVLNASSHVTRLIRQGKLATAIREMVAEASFWQGPLRARDVAARVLKASTPRQIKRASRPWRQRAAARRFVESSLISRDLARQADVEERCTRMYSMFPVDWVEDPAVERIRKVRPNVSAGRERYGRLARFAGLEARDPFLDLHVARFCTQVPGHLLERDGWPKWVLRQAMTGRLPDEVRWGRGKPHVGWAFSERFLKRELGRGNLTLERLRSSLLGRVDDAALERGWRVFLDGRDHESVERAYVLSLWLDRAATRPIAKNQPLGYSLGTGNGSAETGHEIS